jgi:hypothetical protein
LAFDRMRTLACVEQDVQQVLFKVDWTGALAAARAVSAVAAMTASCVALPCWQDNMLEATQHAQDLNTALATLKQQLTEACNTFNTDLAGFQEQQQQQ